VPNVVVLWTGRTCWLCCTLFLGPLAAAVSLATRPIATAAAATATTLIRNRAM
jgi:hypothetical protein